MNPKCSIDANTKDNIVHQISQVILSINSYSPKKGRFVEEKNLIYGYTRTTPYGTDAVLDLLLIYRKYRGKKLSLPVRRHIYIHQHFTGKFNRILCIYMSTHSLFCMEN